MQCIFAVTSGSPSILSRLKSDKCRKPDIFLSEVNFPASGCVSSLMFQIHLIEMESLVQRLQGWGGGRGGYRPPGRDGGGYFPPSTSLLTAGDSDGEEEDEAAAGAGGDDDELDLQLGRLDKSYQKFSISGKQ